MTNGQQHDIDERRAALEERIRRRELQVAQFGVETPPHVQTDLDQARRDLAALDILAKPKISPQVLDAVPPNEREHAAIVAILSVNAELAELKRELRDERQRDAEDRERRRLETDRYRDYVEAQVRRLWMSVAANATATVVAWLFGRRALLVRGAALPPLWKWLASAYVFVGVGLVWAFRTRYGLWRDDY